jgi:1-acyl-sn-glycerol-3-phosphate acyltransferase
LDVLTHPAILPWDTRYVAKRELASIPIFGGSFERVGNLFVQRGGTEETRAAFNEGIRASASRPILIFPEGTRTRDGALQPLKLGFVHIALATQGMPVVPIVSKGAFELLKKGERLPRPGRIDLHIGAPISTENWTSEQVEAQAEIVAEAMRGLSDAS